MRKRHSFYPYLRIALKNIVWSFIVMMFYSCASITSLTYFQGKDKTRTDYDKLQALVPVKSIIQSNDILAIVVSSLSPESNTLFNYSNSSNVTMSTFPGGAAANGIQPLGYMVDAAGDVSLPVIGKLKLAGMTVEEASKTVTEQLSKYLKSPTVNIRQLNHKFTLIGEVNRPGVYNLLNDNTTLPEIIGIGGDLTVYGRRDNIMLLRTTNGKREIYRVNLLSRDVLNSPYYYIRNDDVVYVESRSGKITATDRGIQLVPFYLGILSSVLIIINFVTR